MPTASAPDQVVHFILARKAVESPDSAQPKPPHVGSCSSVPLTSCSTARKVSAPVGEAVPPGEAAGVVVAGAEAGAVGEEAWLAGVAVALGVLTVTGVFEDEDAAELVEESQAVNRMATHARDAQHATCRDLSAFVISMIPNPSINE